MNNMELLLEELDAKRDLGMGEDALVLCEKILSESEETNAQAFESVITAVGMFADKCATWQPALEQWFNGFSERERIAVTPAWISFLVSAEADWDTIKPHVRIRQLPEEVLYIVCDAASDAADKGWCAEALHVLGHSCRPEGGCAERLSRACLLTATGDYLGALEALRGFHVELHHYQNYVPILTKATAAHCLRSLDSLSQELPAGESDVEFEMELLGFVRRLREQPRAMIAKARKAAEALLDL